MTESKPRLSTDVCVPLSDFPALIEETEEDYKATAEELSGSGISSLAHWAFRGGRVFDWFGPKHVMFELLLERLLVALAAVCGSSVL